MPAHSPDQHGDSGDDTQDRSETGPLWKCLSCGVENLPEAERCIACDRIRPRGSVHMSRSLSITSGPPTAPGTEESKRKRPKSGDEERRSTKQRRSSKSEDGEREGGRGKMTTDSEAEDDHHHQVQSRKHPDGVPTIRTPPVNRPQNQSRGQNSPNTAFQARPASPAILITDSNESLRYDLESEDLVPQVMLKAKSEGRELTLRERIIAFNQKKALMAARRKGKESKLSRASAPAATTTTPSKATPQPAAQQATEQDSKPKPKEVAEVAKTIKTEDGPLSRPSTPSGYRAFGSGAPPRQGPLLAKHMHDMNGGLWTRVADGVYYESQPNGGGMVLHVFLDEKWEGLGTKEREVFVEWCVDEMVREEGGNAVYCMGIIHGGVKNMPNLMRYLAEQEGDLPVMVEDFQTGTASTVSINRYVDSLDMSYQTATHQAGPMRNISLVGTVQEETGGFFEGVLQVLKTNDFVRACLPWARLSLLNTMKPDESDDGPIMWTRSGEQVVRMNDGRYRGEDPGSGSSSGSLRMRAAREKTVTDRTNCHADFSGSIPERLPVAAVGLVQSCDPDMRAPPIICKHVVCFHAKDMDAVRRYASLDFNEEPMDQTTDKFFWMSTSKLNYLRRQGVKYARLRLVTGDLYFIPRKVVHQFHTVAACTSVAWHLRYHKYKEFEKIDNYDKK
eukprot:comp6664_c0_seq1/m.2441 comp6664_c0_seq1/g.2441  ORF comp6664_c0_seq1/g.2441 comp6664_c0_seq1/m.2441 type:complete len:675 (-) comp6664_c0_seq1:610-2634(-)